MDHRHRPSIHSTRPVLDACWQPAPSYVWLVRPPSYRRLLSLRVLSCCAAAMSFRVLPLLLSAPSLSTRLRNLWLPGAGAAQLEAAERRVLSRVRVSFLQRFVPIGDGQCINTLHIAAPHSRHGSASGTAPERPDSGSAEGASSESVSILPPSSSAPPLVLLHGFGAGIGLWYGNLDALSSMRLDDADSTATANAGTVSSSGPALPDVYALDLLGCGRSSRPHFSARTTAEAESFFVDSLDRWRAANGIERMCLAGHSFGGYMAAAYAMRFPHRVSRLVLLSPVGVPHQPADYQRRLSAMPTSQRALYGLVNTLWQSGVTPNHFIRAVGPYGKTFIDRYVSRRFPDSPSSWSDQVAAGVAAGTELDMGAAVDAMDKHAVSEYLYQMIVAPSSGDQALSLILKPGAFAHQPLADRLPAALTASSSSSAVCRSVPVVFVYGVADWMDRAAGSSTAAAISARGGAACTLLVKGAGHQLMVDNPSGFKECMQAALSFPDAEAGQASRQHWSSRINAHHKHIIVDT